ncbi:MAG TPA: arylamine N-acetyltransferase [Gaiellaceae bacterium]|nr:arylamine N-acetyltransferase [Gaiellaceae bacterium]
MSRIDTAGYLARLRVPPQGPPSVEGLRRLHIAHVEQVPYQNLEIQLGRPTTVNPIEAADRILRRRGGYCFHLNGSFSALLGELGYTVTRHLGGVQRIAEDGARVNGGHMALTVSGLPDETCPDGCVARRCRPRFRAARARAAS